MSDPAPTFFAAATEFRAWLERHHADVPALVVGFRKAHVADRGLTHREALDQALCFGWIDGIVRSLGPDTYCVRFTPRRKGSYWSAVNTRRMQELVAAGLAAAPGRAAFERRDPAQTAKYSFEQRTRGLGAATAREFRRNAGAWKRFNAFPPGYRNTAAWWVMSAKREETRARRLATLIDLSARGERLPSLGGASPARATPAKGGGRAAPPRPKARQARKAR